MASTLPHVAHEHHERLAHHIDHMPAVGDLLSTTGGAELESQVREMCSFLTDLLIPHMEASERALYPELERMLQNRHSMTPMRHEHTEIRGLIDELVRRSGRLGEVHVSVADVVGLRRLIFRLYSLLKVHLAEEQLYLGIVEHGVSADVGAALAAAMEHAGITAR